MRLHIVLLSKITYLRRNEEFEELNKESVKITGEELYDIDEVLRRLADL